MMEGALPQSTPRTLWLLGNLRGWVKIELSAPWCAPKKSIMVGRVVPHKMRAQSS